MKKLIKLIILLFIVSYAKAEIYDVSKLGADKEGVVKCTEIINKAIEQAYSNGGGTIYFPAGNYLTGPIHLKSNITLYLEAGTLIRFSDDFDDYLPYVNIRYEGIFMKSFSPLIYAVGAENIAIKGEGEIDGNGKTWWLAMNPIMKDVRANGKVSNSNKYQELWKKENSELVGGKYFKNEFFRPPFIQFIECKNINIEGVTIKNSPFWTVNPVGCDDVRISGLTILNPHDGYNTDGVNPSSCSNVRISDCFISVGDDCVTIKSGRDKYGRDYGLPCENITVTNCIMLNGHGGVVIGSEMSGGVKNITISNCVFNGTDNGIRLKSARGRGGVVENIRVDNIVMKNIKKDAFIFNLFYDKGSKVEPVSERTPIFRDIHISNVTGANINRVGFLTGIEEMPVSGLSFNNINISAEEGFKAKTASNLHFSNVDINVKKGSCLSFVDCNGLVLNDVRSGIPLDNQAILEVAASRNVLINNCFQMVQTQVFSKITESEVVWGNNYFNLLEEKPLGSEKK